jgi:death-on-curing protein
VRYLSFYEALNIHKALVRTFGGNEGVRDRGLVEAALLRPQTGGYADLIEEAAALWESLTTSPGFVDGNKRTAFACTEIFLDLNGVRLMATPHEVAQFVISHLAASAFHKYNIEQWLRANTKPAG